MQYAVAEVSEAERDVHTPNEPLVDQGSKSNWYSTSERPVTKYGLPTLNALLS